MSFRRGAVRTEDTEDTTTDRRTRMAENSGTRIVAVAKVGVPVMPPRSP